MTDEEWEQRRRAQLAFRRTSMGWSSTPANRPAAAAAGGFTHGTRYAYQQKKCRCPECKEWARLDRQHRRSLHRAEVA